MFFNWLRRLQIGHTWGGTSSPNEEHAVWLLKLRGLESQISQHVAELTQVKASQQSLDNGCGDVDEPGHSYLSGYTGLALYQLENLIVGRINYLKRRQQRHLRLEPLDPMIFRNS
jgi:hypothetical protein